MPSLRGGVEQQFLDVARVGASAHHVQEPIAAVPVAAELDADPPIGVVELGLFGGGEIPIDPAEYLSDCKSEPDDRQLPNTN